MKKKPTILIIGPLPPPYHGMSTATEMILGSFLKETFTFIHLDTADRREIGNMGRLDGTNLYLAIRHGIQCLYLLLTQSIDLVYLPLSQNVWGYLRDMVFIGLALLFQKKIVAHLHGGYFAPFYKTAPRCLGIGWTMQRIPKVIVLGERIRDELTSVFKKEQMEVIPNGVPDDFEGEFVKGKDPPHLLFLGNLIPEKGFLEVLRVVPDLLKSHPIHVDFGGAWPNQAIREETLHLVETLKIERYVTFWGVVTGDQKKELLKQSTLFLFPTYYPYEGHPYVILEAMSAGLPIVTTPQGVIAETVLDGENGILVPQKNS